MPLLPSAQGLAFDGPAFRGLRASMFSKARRTRACANRRCLKRTSFGANARPEGYSLNPGALFQSLSEPTKREAKAEYRWKVLPVVQSSFVDPCEVVSYLGGRFVHISWTCMRMCVNLSCSPRVPNRLGGTWLFT